MKGGLLLLIWFWSSQRHKFCFMKALKAVSSCVGLACVLGCAQPISQVPAQPSAHEAPAMAGSSVPADPIPGDPEDESKEKPPEDRRIMPLPDDKLLGAESREQRDDIITTLFVGIAERHHPRKYFIGACDRVSEPGNERSVRYYDLSAPVMHRLAPVMYPLSAFDKSESRILVSQITVTTNRAKVDITMPKSPEDWHFSYRLHFDKGEWKYGPDPADLKGTERWIRDFWVD